MLFTFERYKDKFFIHLTLSSPCPYLEPSSAPLKNVEKGYDFSAMAPLQVINSLQEIDKIKKELNWKSSKTVPFKLVRNKDL